jgi:hypothetical protein
MGATLADIPALRLVRDNGYYRGVTLRPIPKWVLISLADAAMAVSVFALVSTSLGACDSKAAESTGASGEELLLSHSGRIFVIHDLKRHATCWLYDSSISCLPDRSFEANK